MELSAKQIDAIAELQRYGIKYEHTSDDWVKVLCPFHADTSSSCGVNIRENYYKCHAAGCGNGGDVIAFLAGALKTTRALMLRDLVSRYALNDGVQIEPSVIERDHKFLWECGPQLLELRNRAVSDDVIRKYRIGARMVKDAVRITIPIKNEVGLYVNVRKYLPGAAGADKMRNESRCGKIRLYPIEQLSFDTIMICGGELKAIVAAEQLNPHGIGAISTTGGEGSWKPEFTELFAGKRVYVCFDIDEAGLAGAISVCRYVGRVASWCGLLELPLSKDEFPHGDINDFVAHGGNLFPLLESVPAFSLQPLSGETETDIEPVPILLANALQTEHSNQPLEVVGRVSAHGSAFRVPKSLNVICDKSQPCCVLCPVFRVEDDTTFQIQKSDAKLLQYVGENKNKWTNLDKDLLGVPSACHAASFERTAEYTIQEIEIAEPTGIGNTQRGFWFKQSGDAVPITENFTFTGTTQAFPGNGMAVFFAYKQELRDNELSEYQRPKNNGKHLQLFQPDAWTTESLEKKLNQIHDDLGNNPLRVYFRNDMNLIADLAFHSVLEIPFDGRTVRGWVDVLIVGDSGQAKTSMVDGLIAHYGVGIKKDCKNATIPGLLATTRRGLSGQYIVCAGAIPQSDRQLIVLEEFKGIQQDVLQKLTEVRSSGMLSVTKAAQGEFLARVRLIVMSNPKSTRPVRDYSFGTEILSELIPSLEDIRRFDAAIILSSDDIDPSKLSARRLNPTKVPHTFTAELCRELIIWAWTRTPAQVQISRESFGMILSLARTLQDEFTDALPLVDSTMALKLAKLSTALAARTFSTNEGDCAGEFVVVRPCHVAFVAATLRRIYSQPAFGYNAYSESLKRVTGFQEKVVDYAIRDLGLARSLVELARHHDRISATDVGNWIGATDYSQANAIISLLSRCGALSRVDNTAGAGAVYMKTPQFNEYLKRAERDETLVNTKGPLVEDKF